MERIKLIKSTRLDMPAKVYIARTARKEFWRMPSHYELDDLIQDGYFLWHQLLSRPRYAGITDKPQIMKLFKLAFACWINDKSKEHRIKDKAKGERWTAEHFAEQCIIEPEILDNLLQESEQATFNVMCNQAPAPIKQVLRLVTTDEGREVLRADYKRRSDGTRETLNDRLCAVCGLPPGTDVVKMTREYFMSPDDLLELLAEKMVSTYFVR